MKFKDIFCNRRLDLQSRIKLFEAVVTPTVLYGCAAWTLTSVQERRLTTTRRRMLRWIAGLRRHGLEEDWVDFVKRATHSSEQYAERHGAKDWVLLYKAKKWNFAGKTARQHDGRWSHKLLDWTPWFRTLPYRTVGRPMLRWDDCFQALCGGTWLSSARDQILWYILGSSR